MPAHFKTEMVREFGVNIIGLSNKVHHFDYELSDSFFTHYGQAIVDGGSFKVEVALDKRETFIEARFSISGSAKLICDKSLEPFDFPLHLNKKIVFKFGEEEMEISDEIIVITREKASLELGQFIYEFICLEIPLKKVHPKFQDEEEDENGNGKIIYSSGNTSDVSEQPLSIDPRWEKLKNFKVENK